MIRIALRFDDPSATSDHALERGILRVLEELGIPATFAVVPCRRKPHALLTIDAANVPHLVAAQAAGSIEIAQHGYTHESLASPQATAQSEFRGVSATEQARRIDAGRDVLESAFRGPVTGFVPPWNTHDEQTSRILAERGYAYISGNLGNLPEPVQDIRFIPLTSHLNDLEQACGEADRRWFPTTIVAVMHHYDFSEAAGSQGTFTIESFGDLLLMLRDRPSVRFMTLGQLAAQMSVGQCRAACVRHARTAGLHWRLQRWLPSHLLFERPLWMYLGR